MSDILLSLIEAVEKADSATALSDAVQDLADADLPESAPYLIEALSYNNPGAAVAAVDGLVKLGLPVVPELLKQLDLHNYTARSWAIRALAGIGDPRGLPTLLEAATADISMSVRRAATRGLGQIKWHQFPPHFVERAQTAASEALLSISQHDEEWVVRYAAVVGLEALALAAQSLNRPWQSGIFQQLDQMAAEEDIAAVRARARRAQQFLQEPRPATETFAGAEPSPLSGVDWQQMMAKINGHKTTGQSTAPKGDINHFQEVLNAG
ncbi:MAG: HEAT repeat domain-containing protein [Cyanobacteria bacterium P01_D01_bin.71]